MTLSARKNFFLRFFVFVGERGGWLGCGAGFSFHVYVAYAFNLTFLSCMVAQLSGFYVFLFFIPTDFCLKFESTKLDDCNLIYL